jgi:ABC-type multidrug transport system ATPase subunit
MARQLSQHYPPESMNQVVNGMTLSVDNLSKRFNLEWIFRNLSFTFEAGNTYAITGPNGSGKSTLLQVLWGQVPQTSGTLSYKKGSLEIPLQDSYKYVSIATPYMDLIEEFTLLEQLKFHFQLKSIRSGVSINDLLAILYLDHARDKAIGNFSSGMKQRVKLGLALYTQAELVFLDEPGTNLDERAFEWYLTELKKLPKQCVICIASNNPKEYPEEAIRLDLTDYKK